MPPELLPYLEQANFYQASLRRLGALLPADDEVLSDWIAQTIRANEPGALMSLLFAALDAGRKVNAKHLEEGTRLLPAPQLVLVFASRMEGDVSAHLMAAVQKTTMGLPVASAALVAIAAWCEERQQALPTEFRSTARLMARVAKKENHRDVEMVFFHGLAAITHDEDLQKVLFSTFDPTASEEKKKKVLETAGTAVNAWLKVARLEVMTEVPEEAKPPSRIIAQGTTMRRAVERIGRNEPCPCGSGKKYKRCCYEKDQKRLHESSHVAGMTMQEFKASPEPYLTREQIEGVQTYALVKWDPLKIKPELREVYLEHLAGYRLWDRLVEVYTILGFTPEIEKPWKMAITAASENERRDIVEKLVHLRKQAQPGVDFALDLYPRLLLAGDDAKEKLRLINEAALSALKTEDAEALEAFAYNITNGDLSALGIFVARSMIPILPLEKASKLFEDLLRTRDILQLSPDDPFSDVIDKRLLKAAPENEPTSTDAAALRKAERNLDRKGEEVRELKESVARLQRELTLREKRNARETREVRPKSIPAENNPAIADLRQKLGTLKDTLKQRHDERNELRRELHQAQAELEELRQKQVQPQPANEEDREQDLLLSAPQSANHPVRLVEFPKKFEELLKQFPIHVARATMSSIGRLAAGEQAAFVGAMHLKACPDITRQRIGGDHRLLFKLHPNHLEVVTLINRRDLERTIKALS